MDLQQWSKYSPCCSVCLLFLLLFSKSHRYMYIASLTDHRCTDVLSVVDAVAVAPSRSYITSYIFAKVYKQTSDINYWQLNIKLYLISVSMSSAHHGVLLPPQPVSIYLHTMRWQLPATQRPCTVQAPYGHRNPSLSKSFLASSWQVLGSHALPRVGIFLDVQFLLAATASGKNRD